jgi:hypothetical protein
MSANLWKNTDDDEAEKERGSEQCRFLLPSNVHHVEER